MNPFSRPGGDRMRKRVEDDPDRYLEIRSLNHGHHHEILKEFLDSKWTEDEELRQKAKESYFGSFGGWIPAVDNNETVHSYFNFRDRKIESMTEEFLHENGIEPEWN